VLGNSPGTTVEDLDLSPGKAAMARGITLEQIRTTESERPVTIRNCRIQGLSVAIRVSGIGDDFHTPVPCTGIMIRDNLINDTAAVGIGTLGDVRHVHIVGNRILCSGISAIRIQNLFETTEDIQVANNTISEGSVGIQFWDDAKRGVLGSRICIQNNLILRTGRADMLSVDSADVQTERGESDGKLVASKWTFANNWREGIVAKPSKGWIPPSAKDVMTEKIDGLDRDPKSPTFLRPAKESPLATQGAGNEDPTLPRYIGALPPAGVEPWDWNRVWR
jgi:hypothetical protein